MGEIENKRTFSVQEQYHIHICSCACKRKCLGSIHVWILCTHMFTLDYESLLTRQDVYFYLIKCELNKNPGPDGIPGLVLELTRILLSSFDHSVFQQYLSYGNHQLLFLTPKSYPSLQACIIIKCFEKNCYTIFRLSPICI